MWMSTTLIQALRHLVILYSSFFDSLKFVVDDFLEICINFLINENDTLAKLGSDCVISFIHNNVKHLDNDIWDKIVLRFASLFEVTTPKALYFDVTGDQILTPFGESFSPRPSKKDFQKIISKCVLHLLVIDTLIQILSSPLQNAVYESLSSRHLFKLGDSLNSSYIFAKSFNSDLTLRQELHKMGFLKQLPNLLKQETTSVSGYIIILSRMYTDQSRREIQPEVERRLIPYD